MITKFPFGERWREKMSTGQKICTSRTKRYGDIGETFEALGCTFVIDLIEKEKLRVVANDLYKQEGCGSPGEFIQIWEYLHPIKKFVPEQEVYVHWFHLKGGKK